MTQVVVLGASGHAKVVIEALRLSGVEVIGLLDATLAGGEFFGCPVLGSDDLLGSLLKARCDLRVIAGIGNNALRWHVTERLTALFPDLSFAAAIHPSAIISPTASIGPGAYIGAGAVVNPATRVAAHAIVNTRASLDHDCTLGDWGSLGPAATLGGNVCVGSGAHVGLGASVLQGIRLGAWSYVGAGAVVTRDMPDRAQAIGMPAKVRRTLPPAAERIV